MEDLTLNQNEEGKESDTLILM